MGTSQALYRILSLCAVMTKVIMYIFSFACVSKIYLPISNRSLQTHIAYLLVKKVGMGLTRKRAADKFFSTSLSEK